MHAEGVIFVLVQKAALCAVCCAQICEIRHKCTNLPGMNVVREWEWSVCETNLVSDSASKPWLLKDLFPDRVLCFASRTHEIKEELDLDTSFIIALNPSWIGTVDWSAICSDEGCHC